MSGDYMFYEGQHWVRVSNNQMETDLRTIHREAFLAALGGTSAIDVLSIDGTVHIANSIAREALRQWPAACAERDRVIEEMNNG